MAIKVRATARGYYLKLREEGDEFDVRRKEDIGSWMDPIVERSGKKDSAAKRDEDPLT